MQLSNNQISTTISRNLQRFGFGVAIVASTLASQAEAQVDFTFSDVVAVAPDHAMIESAVATTAAEKIHRYSLDQAGNLNGQVTVAGDKPSGLSVFAMRGKKITHQATTNSMGEFSMAEITPGPYSLVIAGRNQLAVQGIMIDQDRSQNANDFIQMSTIQTGYQGVQDLVTTALPQQITANMGAAENKTMQVSAMLAEIPIAKQVQIINGEIRGQVVSLINEDNIAGTTIHMLQNSKPVAQVEIDSEGYFAIPDAEAGIYDVVATADSGIAAMRFEAIAKKTPMTMVSYTQQIPTELSIPLAEDCPCNQTQIGQDVAMEVSSQSPIQYANESIGCGGACGGSGGAAGNFSNVSGRVLGTRGGGLVGQGGQVGQGFFGGGRLGAGGGSLSRLASLAGLAVGVAAIADDDDDGDDPAPASNASN